MEDIEELQIHFVPMTLALSQELVSWVYPAEYELYNWEAKDDIGELMCGDYYAWPDVCGRGYGSRFVQACMGFGRERYQAGQYRLTVASFNQRAVRAYEKAGFRISLNVNQVGSGREFKIMYCK